MLVSYAGGAIAQAVPVHLPTVVRLEGPSTHRDGRSEPAEGLPATFFLDYAAKVDRIDLLGEQGEVVAEVSPKALDALRQQGGVPVRPMAVGATSASISDLRTAFPHIRFLDSDMGDELPAIFKLPRSKVEELVSLDSKAAGALLPALKRIPEAAIGAVRSVGVAKFAASSGVIGISFGGSMLVSDEILTETNQLVETVVHEATHNLQFLVDGHFATGLWNPEVWPSDVKEAAEKTISKHRLEAGLTRAWSDLHETGVDLDLVAPYQGEEWKEFSDDLASYGGFASPYGASEPSEDMAEYVGRLNVPENGGEAAICRRIRAAPDPFPANRAVPYAKVRFLEALELVNHERVEACAGMPAISGPPGIHLGEDVHFADNQNAGWLNQDGGRFLAVLGEALPYRFMLRVLVPDGAEALGLHRLDNIGLGNVNDANNAVYLAHDDDNLRARTSAGGLVLVTEAGPERVEGAIFLLSLRSAAGFVTDSFALSTFSVPSK